MDKMREDFEDWFCSTIPYQIAKESWFAIMDDGDYIVTDVQAAWAGWKASRAALCVELPDMPQGKYLSQYDEGFSDCLSIVITVLEDAEVSYK